MMKVLILSLINIFADFFDVPAIFSSDETRKVLRRTFIEKSTCTVVRRWVKILDEGKKGGEPERLAPGFFSFPFCIF